MSENKKPPTQWINSPDGVPEYYANMVNILWTLDDVRFRIGTLVENPNQVVPGVDFNPIARATAAITLSWRNVKLLRDDLVGLINAYEKVNGEINTNVAIAPNKEQLAQEGQS
jgi:hypothetical protein